MAHTADLPALRAAYSRGENIMDLMRKHAGQGEVLNTVDSIELAYDLQAGIYVAGAESAPDIFRTRTQELAYLLGESVQPGDVVLDCGAGELTTTTAVAKHLPPDLSLLAFDISLSRILAGQAFARAQLAERPDIRLAPFMADMQCIPLPDAAVDVVWTCHAIEPNHGREEMLLRELLRVTRRSLVLFEPSWENNSAEGRMRMERLGYVRDLPRHIEAAGGVLVSTVMVKHSANALNPTCRYVVTPHRDRRRQEDGEWFEAFACPISGRALTRKVSMSGVYWWSAEGGYAYPEIEGVPCLRERHAILMTRLPG